MKPSNLGNIYEDFEIGEIIKHSLSKTIFESDNNLFCLLTMNHHPIHTNINYAKDKILVVGTLVLSLVVGITVPDISGKAIANLGYDKVKHLAPVYIGDTIYAQSEILSKRRSKSNPKNGILTVETTGFNQNNNPIIKFERSVLL